ALGAHRPRIDRDETDIVAAILPGERQREVLPRGIGGARADFPVRRLDAVIADQVHDAAAALFDHDGERVAQAAHVAHEFELQAFVPVVFGQMLDHAAGGGTCIIDHDVDAAERLGALLDEILGVGVFAQIGGDGDDLAAGLFGDLLGGGFEWLLAARTDGDIDAFARQRQRNTFADAFAAAGDQRGLDLEFEVHRFPPSVRLAPALALRLPYAEHDVPSIPDRGDQES